MNVIRVELIREIGNMAEYKITYQEEDSFTVKKVGRTFNCDYEEVKTIPDVVLEFVENWILGEM